MPTEPMGPVVVGIDRSETSLFAVDLAAEEAAARLTPLIIVHGYTAADARLPAHHDLLELAVSRALANHPGLAVTAKLVLGDPIRVLAAQSAHACLLVVGHQRAAARRVPTATSVAAQVMLESQCPAIAHLPTDPERQTEEPSPVLLGVTRHARAESVVEFAFEEAALRGAPLRALHVWPERDEATRLLAETLETWSTKFPQVPVRHRVWSGFDVARALCAESLDAQLMVVGVGRYSGRTRVLRGLAAQHLLDFAGCPLMVVPHD
jgi:nucleotide-binding universal stress UspA family protein